MHDSQEENVTERGKNLCTAALRIINGERQTMYGDPEDSFRDIAARWTQRLRNRGKLRPGEEVDREDVAFMMADYKMARETYQAKRDNLVDAVGYLGMLDDFGAEADILRRARQAACARLKEQVAEQWRRCNGE